MRPAGVPASSSSPSPAVHSSHDEPQRDASVTSAVRTTLPT